VEFNRAALLDAPESDNSAAIPWLGAADIVLGGNSSPLKNPYIH